MPTTRHSRLRSPAVRAAAGTVVALVLIVAAGAAWDPSGLLAPVSGRGLPLMGAGGVYRWAPLLVGLPTMLLAAAVPILVIGDGRVKRTGWRVFLVTWAAVVAAAALATAATGLVSATPLIGPHLSAGSALRFAFATGGFAAMKFLLVGPLVAAAAALAHRLGPSDAGTAVPDKVFPDPRPDAVDPDTERPASAVGVCVALMFVVVALAALAFGASWWRGGPVGYAFAGLLPAPSAAAGPVGYVCGVAVFLGVFGATVGALQQRLVRHTPPAVAATVWLASTVAGLGIGVACAVAAALPSAGLRDAGPDSWWIGTTLLSVGSGLGYGTAVGLIGAIGAGVAWRWRPARIAVRLRGPRRWAVGAPVVVLLVALPLLIGSAAVPGPQPVAPVPASAGLQRLHLLPAADDGGLPTIGDVTGRQVILRGVNVNQLIDYHLRDPAVPATEPLTDADFAQIAAMGFNVVRLGMSWSRLEPRRGEFNQAYLQQISTAVASAKAHGVYVVLDMHQDAWGNALARPGEQCGGGTSPTTGWDGAPAWATITDGTLHCQFLARDLAPAVATAFGNFYTDRDGIQSELVRTWAYVARAFADEPAVAGYDLLNEPGIGANPPISSGLLLGRYYDAAITAIRDAERAGQGFPHLVFFEPSVLWSGLAFDVTPPPGFTSDRQLVFAPHPYSESISMDQSFGLTVASIERNLAVSARAAASYGAAYWPGEWGWFGDPAVDGAKVARFGAAQDQLGIGGAFWVWKQGCGSPETGADAKTSGNLARIDCVTGAAIPPPAGFAQPLTRAYPRAFPGRLDRLVANPGDGGLTFGATVDTAEVNCELDIWVPGEEPLRLVTQGVDDAASAKVPGGWQITGCARGTYTVTVTR
ncbi:cellulase family glycosylhydrolase [Catellatospora sichuanensis]|uniref:cellulase family glycosylhydrolase n=1 Tax=Catellatospora sichuanensis TaxID=1969805 RepID=UPI0011836869|nr:cellulase family glycosylhydrolase [Catellatospora sichuanensis]